MRKGVNSMSKDILDTRFISMYRDEMVKQMKQTNPDWDEDDITDIVNDMILKNFMNPTVTLDNNYTQENRETTLLSVFEWLLERKPIIAGNGTFYKNQYEAENPIAEMLDSFLTLRKEYKKKMFSIEDATSYLYRYYDLKQGNEKKLSNSYYGSSGTPSSAFYSLHSGPATTLSAQSVISTAKNFFEAFLADNYVFLDTDELFYWIGGVLEEQIEVDSFIEKKTAEDVFDRLYGKLMQKDDCDDIMLLTFLKHLDENQLSVLYYKNNMIEFLNDHRNVANILYDIMKKVPNLEYAETEEEAQKFYSMSMKKWNAHVDMEYFLNPNKAPDNIKSELDIFKKYVLKYVFSKYLSFDRIYRLRNFKRRVVTVIDTDSNILSLDILMDWLLDNIIGDETFGRDKQLNDFILVNSVTYVITDAIRDILLFYGEHSNIPEKFRPRYSMKNEFFMCLLVIGMAKKRYISKILLREGNLMNPPKQDVKGFDFKKASCSEYAEKRFMKIIEDRIINSPSIDLHGINADLQDFENQIRSSINSGDIFFLPNGSAKELQAYKEPEKEQSVRGVLAWNIVCPDRAISLPAKISLLKTTIFDLEDIDDLAKTNPLVYDAIKKGIFEDDTGIFVTRKWESEEINYVYPKLGSSSDWVNKIPKKYRAKYKGLTPKDWNAFVDSVDENPSSDDPKGHWIVKSRGMQVLAIPSNEKIPEWVIPYIDINIVVDSIIAPFKGVLELFGNQFIEEGKTRNGVSRKTERYTNIVKF